MTDFVTIDIKVPPTSQWQPDRVLKFTHQLIASASDLRLQIWARPNNILWRIEFPSEDKQSVVNTLYAFYPEAQLGHFADFADAEWGSWGIEVFNPFIFPIGHVHEFKTFDPLISVVKALSELNSSELMVYDIHIMPAGQDYYALGQKIYKKELTTSLKSKLFDLALVGLGAALSGKQYIAPPPKSPEQVVLERELVRVQQIAQQKIGSYLREVKFSLFIKNVGNDEPSPERRMELLRSVRDGLNNFEGEVNGFRWKNDESHSLILSPEEIAGLWHLPTEHMKIPGIMWSGTAAAPMPSQLVNQDEGVTLGTNSYQGRSHPVRLSYPDRVTHINLVGRTRVGKSTLLHHMIHQDIAAGKGVAVIDPHGDLVNAILETSIPQNREQDVVLFDSGDRDYPIALNLLSTLPGVGPDAAASYALSVMRKLFADQWSAGRMETVLDATLRVLVTVPGATIQDIPKMLLNAKFRRRALKNVSDPATLDFWYDEYELETLGQQKEFARPINHRIRKFYRDPAIRRIVCQQDSLNFRHILDHGQIFLANLGGVSEIEGETLGALLVSKMQMAAMSRSALAPEQRTPYYLYIDEVQNFIATSLSKVFSEAGKYGLSLTVANQYLKQLEGTTLEALMGNVGTTIIFRVGPEDARALTPFVKPKFSVEDLTNLDRFGTVVKMQLSGETLPAFSMTTASPLARTDDAAERIARIRQHSRSQYARPKEVVDDELMSRYENRQIEEPAETEDSYFD